MERGAISHYLDKSVYFKVTAFSVWILQFPIWLINYFFFNVCEVIYVPLYSSHSEIQFYGT